MSREHLVCPVLFIMEMENSSGSLPLLSLLAEHEDP